MALIEFEDLPDTTTPLTAANLNNNFNELNKDNIYSTSETNTGKVWTDNRPIYRKVITLGALPNNGTISVASGLTPTDIRLTNVCATAYTSTGSYQVVLSGYPVYINMIANGNINITTKEDFSGYTSGQLTIEYIKTAD